MHMLASRLAGLRHGLATSVAQFERLFFLPASPSPSSLASLPSSALPSPALGAVLLPVPPLLLVPLMGPSLGTEVWVQSRLR